MCETCTAAARVEHLSVTVRGIELRGRGSADTDSPEWVELAPEFAKEPRQVDLLGNAAAEILVEDALVPAGSYREVRLQLVRRTVKSLLVSSVRVRSSGNSTVTRTQGKRTTKACTRILPRRVRKRDIP